MKKVAVGKASAEMDVPEVRPKLLEDGFWFHLAARLMSGMHVPRKWPRRCAPRRKSHYFLVLPASSCF